MDFFKAITFTHQTVGLEEIARFHIQEDEMGDKIAQLKRSCGLDECMILSTCNRVEFYFCTHTAMNDAFLKTFFSTLYPIWSAEDIDWAANRTKIEDGLDAIRHLFHVTGSLDSLVVGEREIMAQFRKAYEIAHLAGHTGDFLRIAERAAIETAKRIFTETDIANRPVSVVNLAARTLMGYHLETDARFLIIGAGVTMRAMLKKLAKHGYHDFTIFNRTLSKAERLNEEVQGKRALELKELDHYTEGFDVLISCTGSSKTIVTSDRYQQLLQGDVHQKFAVDLAVPNDIDRSIAQQNPVELIEIETLKDLAEKNLQERRKAISACKDIVDEQLELFSDTYRERQIELTVREVPEHVRQIRQKTVSEVFAKRLENLDDDTKALMDEMLGYMEKKVNAFTMKKAKEILSNRNV